MVNSENNIIYLATNNTHKAEEFTNLAQGRFKFVVARELNPEISWIESGNTFEENANIKAKTLALHTSQPILADDSGLIVDALGGEPGVYSSRYSGIEGDDLGNMNKLLENLKKLPAQKFSAKFVCYLCYISQDGSEHSFKGECAGEIILTPRGKQGFGYDPIFVAGGSEKTLAEMDAKEKNQISHRYQAFSRWLAWKNRSH